MIAERMRELGIVPPPVLPPVGNYLGCVVDGDLVWVGGRGPGDGERRVTGKAGADVSLEQAREAARRTGLSILATLQAELGDLDRIEGIVRVCALSSPRSRSMSVIERVSERQRATRSRATQACTSAGRRASQRRRARARAPDPSAPAGTR